MSQGHFLDVRNKYYQRTSFDTMRHRSSHRSGEPDIKPIIREPGLAFGTKVGGLMGSEGVICRHDVLRQG